MFGVGVSFNVYGSGMVATASAIITAIGARFYSPRFYASRFTSQRFYG